MVKKVKIPGAGVASSSGAGAPTPVSLKFDKAEAVQRVEALRIAWEAFAKLTTDKGKWKLKSQAEKWYNVPYTPEKVRAVTRRLKRMYELSMKVQMEAFHES